ncbi:hypothetical protein FOVG_09967 [Fusarium oxysporum f. sp. pisi HDV247]|uniref:Uncharacterized protein n=1 Tax=Fusarium oxysporum f. sp. pisi HDV247 TaxID=1080344 RepID=W9PGY2_FUSOX|nr:hypothetical protein FOVG_09967 [Fusarium oxysporum f. sp. pisi HDV247]
MTSDLEYASHFRQDLTSPDHLNVSSTVVKNAKLEPVLRQYVDWLGENTKLGWYLFSVSRVPCIYGWAEIAYQLNQSSSTVRGPYRELNSGKHELILSRDKILRRVDFSEP